jgi:hypothetical protein
LISILYFLSSLHVSGAEARSGSPAKAGLDLLGTLTRHLPSAPRASGHAGPFSAAPNGANRIVSLLPVFDMAIRFVFRQVGAATGKDNHRSILYCDDVPLGKTRGDVSADVNLRGAKIA